MPGDVLRWHPISETFHSKQISSVTKTLYMVMPGQVAKQHIRTQQAAVSAIPL